MELDTKQKVLLALYTEYQKDLPNMNIIKPDLLEMERDVFNVALMKLENEGYIIDLTGIKTLSSSYPSYILDSTKLTSYGIDYVENKLQIDPTATGEEKTQAVWKKVGEWGLDQVKDVIARIAAETIKG
jgi:hypothetical protein